MGRSNGQELNKVSIGEDAGIPSRTVSHYLELLYDTLVAYELPAFTQSRKRKAITRSKFYFFDLGVVGMIAKRGEIFDDSELFGPAFEHFIINEVRAFQSYHRTMGSLHYWRTKTGFEVDLIIDGKIAVEIKATKSATEKHLRGLKALREEGICQKLYLVTRDPAPRFLQKEDIHILPWQNFVQKLWQGSITNPERLSVNC
jgi:predicted AAA+ superfamily ATPase